MKRIATLLALSATISALAAATPSPLATQAWTAHEFFRAIQETGRTNVLTSADRQMISNYVDEVCHLYAVRMAPQEDEATFENGKLVYTVGDTVVTSGFSNVYPKDIMVGIVSEASKDAHSNFYTLKIQLSTNFSRLNTVYVVKNLYKSELDTLKKNFKDE